MNEELQCAKNELLAAIQQSEDRVLEKVSVLAHETETKLLTAFLRWQDNSNTKFQRLKADTGNATRELELRLENVEARLEEVEKRYLSGGGPAQ